MEPVNSIKESNLFSLAKETTAFSLRSIYEYLSCSESLVSFGVGIAGLYYFFLGLKFKKFSIIIITFFICLSYIYQFRSNLSDAIAFFNSTALRFLPENLHVYFLNGNELPCLLYIAGIATSLIIFCVSLVKYSSIFVLFYTLYITLESAFEAYFEKCSKFFCLIFSGMVVLVFNCLKTLVIQSISGLLFSILGTSLIFFSFANRFHIFDGFKELCERLINWDFQVFDNPWSYAFICCSLFSYYLQRKLN